MGDLPEDRWMRHTARLLSGVRRGAATAGRGSL